MLLAWVSRISFFLVFAAFTLVFNFDNSLASAIAESARLLKSGYWYEIPDSRLKDSAYKWPVDKMPGVFFDGIMVAWSGGVLDTKRNRLVIFGGGHTDYGGNEIYGFDLDDFRWHLLAEPSPYHLIQRHTLTSEEDRKPYYPDGLPVARHTYNYIDYHKDMDALISVGYRAGFRRGDDAGNQIDYFDFSQDKWVKNTLPPFPDNTSKCIAVDSKDGHIWAYVMKNSRKLWEYIPEENKWYQRSTQLPWHDWNPYMQIEVAADKKILVVIGHGEYFAFDISHYDEKGHVNLIAERSSGPQDVVKSHNPTLSYDPHSGYMVSWLGGTGVYALNLEKHQWLHIPASQENTVIPTEPASAGTFGRWQYVPGLNTFVVVNSVNENVYLYKFSSNKIDQYPPVIKDFSAPYSASSKTFPLTVNAYDDSRITGYLLTETPAEVSIDDPRWRATPPKSYRVDKSGTYNLFLWVKDLSGNISSSETQVVKVNADDEKPVVDDFVVKPNPGTFIVDILKIHAFDNVAVTGYLLAEDNQAPFIDSNLWKAEPPRQYIAKGCGKFRLNLWVKDAEGNITKSTSDEIVISIAHASKALLVGPRHDYKTIAEALKHAQDGAIIEIDAGIYENDFILVDKDNLTLKGIGGYAHILGTQKIPNGKGLIVQEASHLTLERLELSGARVKDRNGAGVRGGRGDLIIKHCYIHNNENGLLVGNFENAKIIIENSIFDENGDGSGQTHNIYVGNIDVLEVRYCKISNAKIGHNIKTRANKNYIEYNLISEKKSRTSYSVDIPNGGNTYIIGNIIHQGNKAENSSIISYKQDSSLKWNHGREIYVVNNTFINEYKKKSIVLKSSNEKIKIIFINNIVYGNKNIVFYPYRQKSTMESGNLFIDYDPGFKNISNFDFRLSKKATEAINKGFALENLNGYSLIPNYQYKNPADREPRNINGIIDIGAYEFND